LPGRSEIERSSEGRGSGESLAALAVSGNAVVALVALKEPADGDADDALFTGLCALECSAFRAWSNGIRGSGSPTGWRAF